MMMNLEVENRDVVDTGGGTSGGNFPGDPGNTTLGGGRQS